MNGTIESRVPYAAYNELQSLNISKLKHMAKSGKHFRWYAAHPPSSKPMTLGTAAHCAVLEPERFASQFAVWSRRTEAGRSAPRSGQHWLSFQGENVGKTIITEDEYSLAMAMQKAVRSDPIAMRYLDRGDPEVTMEWQIKCGHLNVAAKGRVDWLTKVDGEPVLVGLKTAREARHFAFGAAAAKMGYPLQWAWYLDGYVQITNNLPQVKEIVVESSPPFDVVVYDIPEDILLQGREEYERLLRLYIQAHETNEWLGISEGREHVLTLPSWYYGVQDDLGDIGLEVEE